MDPSRPLFIESVIIFGNQKWRLASRYCLHHIGIPHTFIVFIVNEQENCCIPWWRLVTFEQPNDGEVGKQMIKLSWNAAKTNYQEWTAIEECIVVGSCSIRTLLFESHKDGWNSLLLHLIENSNASLKFANIHLTHCQRKYCNYSNDDDSSFPRISYPQCEGLFLHSLKMKLHGKLARDEMIEGSRKIASFRLIFVSTCYELREIRY